MKHNEDYLQMSCVRWFGLQYPEYARLLHHSPNGGYRNAREAARFKAMGTRAGFPDLILLVARGGYHFLAVEMKTDKGKQSEFQREYERLITEQGGIYYVCRDIESFISIVNGYMQK